MSSNIKILKIKFKFIKKHFAKIYTTYLKIYNNL